jgi:hypothetical protein
VYVCAIREEDVLRGIEGRGHPALFEFRQSMILKNTGFGSSVAQIVGVIGVALGSTIIPGGVVNR